MFSVPLAQSFFWWRGSQSSKFIHWRYPLANLAYPTNFECNFVTHCPPGFMILFQPTINDDNVSLLQHLIVLRHQAVIDHVWLRSIVSELLDGFFLSQMSAHHVTLSPFSCYLINPFTHWDVVTICDTRLGNWSCDGSGDLSPTFSMFVYMCLVTWPILETVYSSHAKGTYFP